MRDWIKRIASWLAQPKLVWLTAAVLLVALLAALRPSATEPGVRFTGLSLQCLGLLTVLYGIAQTRKLFQRPGLVNLAKVWFLSFPKMRPPAIAAKLGINLGSLSMSGRASVRHLAGPNAGIEDRVRVLESNVEALERRADGLQDQIDRANRERAEALLAERESREKTVHGLAAMLEASETGALDVSLMGLIWLISGLVITTASPELGRLP